MSDTALMAVLTASRNARKAFMQQRRAPNVIGRTFGALTVIGVSKRSQNNEKWRVRCACGKERDVFYSFLAKQPPPVCLHTAATRRMPGRQPTVYQIGGEETTIADYARKYGVNPMTLYKRKERGALAQPGPEQAVMACCPMTVGMLVWLVPQRPSAHWGPTSTEHPWVIVTLRMKRSPWKPPQVWCGIRPAGGDPGDVRSERVVVQERLRPWPVTERTADDHAV